MRKSSVLLIVTAIILTAPAAWAQRPGGRGFGGGPGGGISLLSQKSVQDELKLSADQVNDVDEFLAKQRESFSGSSDLSREERQKRFAEGAKAGQAALASILKEDQLKRFKQISLQQRGGQALADPEVAQGLSLTDEQKTKIGEIQTAAREEMQGLFQGGGGGDREEMRKKFQAARDAVNEKLMGLLSPEQQTKWKELTGEPFKGEIRPFGRNRGGGAGNRQRRNRNNDASTSTTGANRSDEQGVVRLASFREDADESDDDVDANDKKADSKKSDARKSKADKPRKSKAKKPKGDAREARHRNRPGQREFRGPSDFSRGPRSQRDRAWDHVARLMGPSMAHRGPGPHGRGPGMPFGMHGGPDFGPRHHGGSFAGFHGHRGPPERQFSFDDRGRGPHMGHTHHRGHHGHHAHMMAQQRGHRHHGPMFADHPGHHGRMMADHPGHHGPSMAHRWPHPGPPPHGMARFDHHGPMASFAGHRGHGHMHHAGFTKHRPHGDSDAGQHRHHRRGDSPRGDRDDDDRDDDDREDRKDRKDKDDD